jgi:class 3 adenylate cyclase
VLATIARSSFDVSAVLEAVIAEAVRLCGADTGNIAVRDGDAYWVKAVAGFSPEYDALVRKHRYEADRTSVVGRTLVERRVVQIPDVLADPEYTMLDLQRVGKFRSAIGVPIWQGDEIIGVIANGRSEVRPFGEREVGILEAFADQVAIALNLAQLLNETHEALERQSAIGEVLQSISRSAFELDRVLQAVIDSAVRLSHADDGNITRGEAGAFGLSATFTAGVPPAFREFIGSRRFQAERGSAMGRALMEMRPVQIEDVLADPEYTLHQAQRIAGFRTILGIPLTHDGAPVGVLSVWRYEVRPFSESEISLLGTFADQAAIAISNVRLFETVERQRTALASFAPHVAGLLSSPEGEALLTGHRREISALFCDMRGFTAFAETAEPEELFSVLREYHAAVGAIAIGNGGMVEHFAGDGFMIFFNDPNPVSDHPLAAIRTAMTMRDRFAELAAGWHRRGYDLGLGIGISVGYATLGRIGFEGRYDYAGVGAVTNLAARLSSVAAAGEILISQRMQAAVDGSVTSEPVEGLSLKGFSHAVTAYRVTGLRDTARSEARP